MFILHVVAVSNGKSRWCTFSSLEGALSSSQQYVYSASTVFWRFNEGNGLHQLSNVQRSKHY